jgi:hypothetical protein
MIALQFTQFVDPTFLESISERGRRRIFKVAMIQALRYWHKYILPKHFTLSGQSMYGGVFDRSKNKAKTGKPALVQIGEFMQRILSNQKVTGTYKGAKARYVFGRPSTSEAHGDLSAYRDKYLEDLRHTNPRLMESKSRNRIFHFMKGKKIKFEEARQQILASTTKKIFSRTTYSSKLRVKMAAGVSIFSQADREEIRVFVMNFIKENMGTLGKANYRKLKGAEF